MSEENSANDGIGCLALIVLVAVGGIGFFSDGCTTPLNPSSSNYGVQADNKYWREADPPFFIGAKTRFVIASKKSIILRPSMKNLEGIKIIPLEKVHHISLDSGLFSDYVVIKTGILPIQNYKIRFRKKDKITELFLVYVAGEFLSDDNIFSESDIQRIGAAVEGLEKGTADPFDGLDAEFDGEPNNEGVKS